MLCWVYVIYDWLKISNVFENWMKGTVDGDVYVDDMTNPTALAVVVPVDSGNKQSTKSKLDHPLWNFIVFCTGLVHKTSNSFVRFSVGCKYTCQNQ